MASRSSDTIQATAPEPVDDLEPETSSLLQQYGITSHQQTTYEWNGYRYSNSSDAIAAAKKAAQ